MRARSLAVVMSVGVMMSVGVLAGAPAGVQGEPVTLTLKSTTRVSGNLVDLNASGFIMRIDGQERQFPKNDVAVVDFGDPQEVKQLPAEIVNLQPGQHAVVLHNGQVVTGEFVDVGGTQPLRISFLTNSGTRDLSSSDVRRIYLARPAVEAGAGAGPASGPTHTVIVPARQAWSETGIVVRRGETLTFDVSGEIVYDRGGSTATAGRNSNNATDRNMPVPSAQTATLIARVTPTRGGVLGQAGASQPFSIGDQRTVVMPADGVLQLGINDTGFGDNRGEFRVAITGGVRR